MKAMFTWSIHNETVLKALFKRYNKELTFNKAIRIASGMYDADKIAKEIMHGKKPTPVYKVSKEESSHTQKTTR